LVELTLQGQLCPPRLAAVASALAALQFVLVSIAYKGHQGKVRTKQRLHDLSWWPGMDSQVQDAARFCHVCQLNDQTVKSHPAPLQLVLLPIGPWQKVAVDLVVPFDTAASYCRFAITLTDYEVSFTHTVNTDSVVWFRSSVFSRHGNPLSIVTDNGVYFMSAAFYAFLEGKNIHYTWQLMLL